MDKKLLDVDLNDCKFLIVSLKHTRAYCAMISDDGKMSEEDYMMARGHAGDLMARMVALFPELEVAEAENKD